MKFIALIVVAAVGLLLAGVGTAFLNGAPKLAAAIESKTHQKGTP